RDAKALSGRLPTMDRFCHAVALGDGGGRSDETPYHQPPLEGVCRPRQARCAIVFRWILVLWFLLVSACSYRTPIEYRTVVAGAENPLTTVKLETIDGRESDMALSDAREIGRLRGLFGNAFPLLEAGPQSVRNVTHDATADALRLARVGVYDRSPRTLVA